MTTESSTLTVVERIRAAIAMGESHFREFKSAIEGPPGTKKPRDPKTVRRDIGEALVAFANADGGELIVGVEDDGQVTGVPHPLPIIESFVLAWTSHVHADTPLPLPRIARAELDAHLILYFAVEKGTSHIHLTQDGRCLQRRDRESVPVPVERINFERQERLSREYDRSFVDDAMPGDLDLETVERIAEQVAPGMSPEKTLQLLDLAEFSGDRVRLRRAAVLLLAQEVQRWHPRCEVRILRVSGTELRTGRDYNVVADKHISGSILELLTTAWEEIRPYLVETRLGPEGRFEEQVRYPEDACREALTNAIAHRDYSIEGRAIEVYVFDDRLEVRSPGALLSTVTIAGLRSLRGVHQSRNTIIARSLRELGYMREMGEGFRRIFHLMRAHDLVEPHIHADNQSFTVSLQHRSVFSEEDQRWIRAYEPFHLERREEKVLLLGRTGQSISVQQIMDALDLVDTEDYRLLILGLQQKGLVRGIPKSRTGASTRHAPRWTVVQPRDANRFLGELLRGAQGVFDERSFGPKEYAAIGRSLSHDTPYSLQQGLRSSFLRLGLVDGAGVPAGALRALIEAGQHRGGQIGSGGPSPSMVEALSPSPASSEADATGRARPVLVAPPGAYAQPSELTAPAVENTDEQQLVIFVDNLAQASTRTTLRDAFSAVAPVAKVYIPRDFRHRNRHRGYAFVTMGSAEGAMQARNALEGASLDGQVIRLEWARNAPA